MYRAVPVSDSPVQVRLFGAARFRVDAPVHDRLLILR